MDPYRVGSWPTSVSMLGDVGCSCALRSLGPSSAPETDGDPGLPEPVEVVQDFSEHCNLARPLRKQLLGPRGNPAMRDARIMRRVRRPAKHPKVKGF